jgi:hypothetical protein
VERTNFKPLLAGHHESEPGHTFGRDSDFEKLWHGALNTMAAMPATVKIRR